jgi:hypothetical protein
MRLRGVVRNVVCCVAVSGLAISAIPSFAQLSPAQLKTQKDRAARATAARAQSKEGQAAVPANPTATISAGTQASAGKAAPALSAYVGIMPGSKVRGFDFTGHPSVVRAVKAALHGSAYQSQVLDDHVVLPPVARQGDLIVYTACEPHNCSFHNWAIVLPTSAREAAVCYYDSDSSEGARWFIRGDVSLVELNANCNLDLVPAQVALALAK